LARHQGIFRLDVPPRHSGQISHEQVQGLDRYALEPLLLTGLAPLLRFGRWDPRYLLMLLPYTFYVLTWAWPVFTAPFQAHDQANWAKTPHTRALRLEELDG